MNAPVRPLIILAYPKVDHEKNYVYHWMPFSILVIAKAIQEQGLADVVLFDGNQRALADWRALLESSLERAVFVGISIMTGGGQIRHALDLARDVRARDARCPIVFGGPHANVLPEQTLEHPLVDFVLTGPGQSSVPALVSAMLGHAAHESVPGLLGKSPAVKGSANQPRVQMLGDYPWELLDVAEYLRADPTIATKTLNYVASQGCVYKCRFCYELVYDRKYSKIDGGTLLDSVQRMVERYGVNGIKFYDADWFVDLNRVEQFSSGLLDRGLRIHWAASVNPKDILRARKVKPGLLDLVARSGCKRLLMGAESGSNRVLAELICKEVEAADIVSVAREISDAGILGSYTFIIGFPTETRTEQQETLALIARLWDLPVAPETRVHVFAPYPGTPLYELSREHGFVPPDRLEGWASYDYYESLTPWTGSDTVELARRYTRLKLPAGGVK